MEPKTNGMIMIECPNTIFRVYVRDENEISKLEIFMNNINRLPKLSLTDVYNWCNRQGMIYETEFNYHRELSLWKNMRFFWRYSTHKIRYRFGLSMG